MKLHEHCILKKKGQNNGRTSIRNLHVHKQNCVCSTECGDQTSIDDAFFIVSQEMQRGQKVKSLNSDFRSHSLLPDEVYIICHVLACWLTTSHFPHAIDKCSKKR